MAHPGPAEHEVTQLYDVTGTVVAVDARKGRIILTHSEIVGVMSAMFEMSFAVSPSTLLNGIQQGDEMRFTIDAGNRIIVDVVPISN